MTQPQLPVTFPGTVTRFQGNGRKLGYPTANFTTSTSLADGVYFGFSDLDAYHEHPSVIFIGTPTTMGDTLRRLETHLLDIPDADYYDLSIEVSPHYFHRSNQTFSSVEALVEAMKADEAAMRRWLTSLQSVHHNS
ncbi:MAG TPA: riboflavin kinase, partial [Candidatus Polarisedimenticolaceae bacterium]|nr:riboflavin kinase [Candidatus Polarisedimenticolaceae bacterium]